MFRLFADVCLRTFSDFKKNALAFEARHLHTNEGLPENSKQLVGGR